MQEQRMPARYSVIDHQTNRITSVCSFNVPSVSFELEQEFKALAEEWYMETMPLSSYIEKILHPAYQRILVLGKHAVPLIMEELRDMPNDWFWALRVITNENPVNPNIAGNLDLMAKAWFDWWEHEGLTWRAENNI